MTSGSTLAIRDFGYEADSGKNAGPRLRTDGHKLFVEKAGKRYDLRGHRLPGPWAEDRRRACLG